MKIAVYCLTLAFLAVVASAARPSVYDSPVASERQLFYGDIANMKQPIRPVYDGEQLYSNKPASYETEDEYRPDYLDASYDFFPPTSDHYDQRPPSIPSVPDAYYNDDAPPSSQYQDQDQPAGGYRPTSQDFYQDYAPRPPAYVGDDFVPTFPDEFYNPFYTSEHQEQEQDDDDYYYNNNNKKPTNVEQGDDDYDVTSFYGGTNQQKPAPKPYKPRPEYPKEVVLLKPSAALKANAYSYKHATPDYKPHAVPGTAGKDYPNYDAVPQTNFDCLSVKQNDYDYTYMHPDREAKCQVFHSCHPDGRQDSFLCPLGTIFDGETQTCDWWFNARCY